jgi:hypothetical protein
MLWSNMLDDPPVSVQPQNSCDMKVRGSFFMVWSNMLDDPPLSVQSQNPCDIEGGERFFILWSNILPPACDSWPRIWVMCVTQRANNKVGENYYVQRKKMCDHEELNPKP